MKINGEVFGEERNRRMATLNFNYLPAVMAIIPRLDKPGMCSTGCGTEFWRYIKRKSPRV